MDHSFLAQELFKILNREDLKNLSLVSKDLRKQYYDLAKKLYLRRNALNHLKKRILYEWYKYKSHGIKQYGIKFPLVFKKSGSGPIDIRNDLFVLKRHCGINMLGYHGTVFITSQKKFNITLMAHGNIITSINEESVKAKDNIIVFQPFPLLPTIFELYMNYDIIVDFKYSSYFHLVSGIKEYTYDGNKVIYFYCEKLKRTNMIHIANGCGALRYGC